MLQRFLTATEPPASDDVDYLLEKMDRVSEDLRPETAVEWV
jgi:hypothetical protein